MDNKRNNKYFSIGLTIFLTFFFCMLAFLILFNTEKLKNGISTVLHIMTPIILGVGIAYFLNPVMVFTEKNIVTPIWNKLKKNNKNHPKESKGNRAFAVGITMIVFLFALYGLIMLIFPQVIESIQSLLVKIPAYTVNLYDWIINKLTQFPELENLIKQYWKDLSDWISSTFIPSVQNLISKTGTSLLGGVIGAFNGIINFIVGLIVSVYLLYSKETFCAQAKKVTYAFLREERANNLINNMRYTNKIFGGFISGKLLDSLIIGILCYICMLILRLPYAELISVIVGITNIIPYFGPFLGAIPSAFILLIIDPFSCLKFIIFILILQQFDGNILGPKILGDSTGLNSFWVIFAITLFSGLFGFIGMFLGVPIFAVIYSAIKTLITQRLLKKDMPIETSYYLTNDYHISDDDSMKNEGREFKFVRRVFENVRSEKKSIQPENVAAPDIITEEKKL